MLGPDEAAGHRRADPARLQPVLPEAAGRRCQEMAGQDLRRTPGKIRKRELSTRSRRFAVRAFGLQPMKSWRARWCQLAAWNDSPPIRSRSGQRIRQAAGRRDGPGFPSDGALPSSPGNGGDPAGGRAGPQRPAASGSASRAVASQGRPASLNQPSRSHRPSARPEREAPPAASDPGPVDRLGAELPHANLHANRLPQKNSVIYCGFVTGPVPLPRQAALKHSAETENI